MAAVLDGAGQLVTTKTYEPDHRASSAIARDIEATICSDAYRIMHIAGHGAFDPDDASRTGVLIGDSTFITATFLSRLHAIPDLVFLNCCHLGKMTLVDDGPNAAAGDFHRLGASLAGQLIQSGVRAVVAAGWAVEDTAAVAFASTFYERMTRAGETFGSAAFAARQAAYRTSPSSSTWGAYQCYGDSGLTLSLGSRAGVPRVPTTVREAMRRIEVLVDHVDSVGASASLASGRDWALEELLVIDEAATELDWLRHPEGALLAEQLGGAFADVQWFSDALRWYDAAIDHPSGLASFRAYEQRANLRGRIAVRVLASTDSTDSDKQTAAEAADSTEADIELLLNVGKTKERWKLLAGHHKRRAVVADEHLRFVHLNSAARGYQSAYEIELAANGNEADPADLFTAIQLDAIRAVIDPESKPLVTGWNHGALGVQLGRLDDIPPSRQDFWLAVGRADGLLATALACGDIKSSQAQIIERYEQAFSQRSKGRERRSSADHVKDLVELHPQGEQRDLLAALAVEIETAAGRPQVER